MKMVYTWITLLLVSSLGLAETRPNCTITIRSQKRNGEKLTIVFNTLLKNEKECTTLATLHKKNFTPETIKSKQVSFVWNGRRSGMLARVARKSFSRKKFR